MPKAARVLFIDDLSVGTHPDTWLGMPCNFEHKNLKIYGRTSV
jgi:hypothetical protein